MDWSGRFFEQRRLTSKIKHLVLQGYVKEFAFHLGSARPVVYYVDGFAGAGRYVRGSIHEDGSPLLIAKLAEQIRQSARPFELRCLNVEANKKRFADLQTVTEPFRPGIVEHNYQDSFAAALPDVLRRVGSAPAFFFIDPFGTKGIAFRDLLPIFQRQTRTEVLINLQTDGMAKKAGWFQHENSTDLKQRELAREMTRHLAAALDISHTKLREGWLDCTGDTRRFENRMLAYYLRKLLGTTTRFNYAKAFPILYYNAGALTEAPVCFYLVFATQNEKGLFEMNDVMVDALRTFYRDVYSDTFFPAFEEEHERRFGRVAVENEILARFADKPSFTIDDVKRHCMQQTAFLLKGGEYRALVLELARSGSPAKKLDPGQPSNSKTRFKIVVNRS